MSRAFLSDVKKNKNKISKADTQAKFNDKNLISIHCIIIFDKQLLVLNSLFHSSHSFLINTFIPPILPVLKFSRIIFSCYEKTL